MSSPIRTLVVHCQDWPLTAARLQPDVPAIEVAQHQVSTANPAARAEGISRGTRLRSAQQRCPDIVVIGVDPVRDARAFEPVLTALGLLTPALEVVRPGVCSFASRGASRYHGGDQRLAELTLSATVEALRVAGLPTDQVGIGIADGPFTAEFAACSTELLHPPLRIVPPGGSPAFLVPVDTSVLDRPELVDLLRRLGIHTLGAFAELPAPQVLDRFGIDGAIAHRLARGMDGRPLLLCRPDTDLAVQIELDPPAERVDIAAFSARTLAERFHDQLAARALVCTRVAIEAETQTGEQLVRLWRHDGALDAAAIAERMRWQLDGWLNGTDDRPTGGVRVLRLVPDQVCLDEGVQESLWTGSGERSADTRDADDRAARALARVQGLLGPEAVRTAVRGGGRSPLDRITWIRWGDPREPRASAEQPWPGQLCAPSPATVFPRPRPVRVTDAGLAPIGVTGRYLVTATPALLTIGSNTPEVIEGWAGPWPVEERWWDTENSRRRARFQVLTVGGSAWLLSVENGQWWAEARYD